MQRYGDSAQIPKIKAKSSQSCCDRVGTKRHKWSKGQNLVVFQQNRRKIGFFYERKFYERT